MTQDSLKVLTGRPLGNFSKGLEECWWSRGGGVVQNVFGPAVQGTSTEQNVERGQEGRGNTRKHE